MLRLQKLEVMTTDHTRAVEHLSPEVSLAVEEDPCRGTNGITEGPGETTQFVEANSDTGFILPAYTPLLTGCPIKSFSVSSSNTGTPVHTLLDDPVKVGNNWVVKPTDSTLTSEYRFFILVRVERAEP